MTTATTTFTVEPGSQAVLVERDFAATPEQLLRAHTDPAILSRWLGPRGYEMTVDELDARHGGRWRYTHGDPEGNVYAFRGIFHGDPSVDDGIIQTFEFEGFPGEVCLEKMTFEDLGDGRTRLKGSSVFGSVEARDGMIESGMQKGVIEGFEQLDEWLAEQAS